MSEPRDKQGPGPAENTHTPFWGATLAQYRKPDTTRSIWQLASAATMYVGTWVLMYFSLQVSYWLTLALAVPAAFFLMRLFIIQHDCGHGAFFKSSRAADITGSILGVLTLTPYHYWKKTHAIHHATSGNLEHRGFGDILTLTVEEYLKLSRFRKFKYRVYRHPLVLFGVGAVAHFAIVHRIPTIVPREWRRERRSILWTDVGLAALVVFAGLLFGFRAVIMVHLPLLMLSCSMGVWLFYVQHQFEPTYWEHDPQWTYEAAALEGSSYYRLPKVLHWLTGNIGFHHIHHLNARIPNYKLPEVFAKHPELQRVTQLTLWQSLKCIRLTLWDERERRLVPFSRLRRMAT
jgi:omega-6 fatty acid desaturase (delta-12 desaturase)